jgi:hypothetical protein
MLNYQRVESLPPQIPPISQTLFLPESRYPCCCKCRVSPSSPAGKLRVWFHTLEKIKVYLPERGLFKSDMFITPMNEWLYTSKNTVNQVINQLS